MERRVFLVGLAVLFVALFGWAGTAEANVSYTLTADYRGWNYGQTGGANPTLTALVGETIQVTIQWVNFIHNFAVYPPGYPAANVYAGNPDALLRSADVTSSSPTATVTFQLAAAGTYEYYCEYHPDTMHGSLVVASPTAAPTADFTFSPSAPLVGQTVAFDASASSDPDGTIVSYAWDFGDGSTGTGVTTSHAYTSAGTFRVTLTVTDNDGLTGTSSKDVTVSPAAGQPFVDLVRRKAWPSDHRVDLSAGSLVVLTARLGNLGTVSALAGARFEVFDASGSSVAVLFTGTVSLAPSALGDVTVAWSVPGTGTYTIVAHAIFDSDGNGSLDAQGSAVKEFSVKAVYAGY